MKKILILLSLVLVLSGCEYAEDLQTQATDSTDDRPMIEIISQLPPDRITDRINWQSGRDEFTRLVGE